MAGTYAVADRSDDPKDATAVSGRPAGVRLALAGGLLLLLGWLAAPSGPPLYDGIGFPDEPYRYAGLTRSAAPTPPPSVGRTSLTVTAGSNADQTYVSSDEQGPQVTVFVSQRLLGAAGATRIDVSVTPTAPDGSISNVYVLAATSDAGPVQMAQPPDSAVVQLRAPSAPPPPAVLAYRAVGGSGWQLLPTSRVGTEIYQARLVGLGNYALVAAPVLPARADPGVSTPALLGLALLVLVLVMALVVLRVRRSARRQA